MGLGFAGLGDLVGTVLGVVWCGGGDDTLVGLLGLDPDVVRGDSEWPVSLFQVNGSF